MRWIDTFMGRCMAAVLGAMVTTSASAADESEPGDALIYFTQSWCPAEAEVRRLSKTLILSRRGCCIVYGSARDPGGVPAGALTAWRDKIVSKPDGNYCRGSEWGKSESEKARIKVIEDEDRDEIAAEEKLKAKQAADEIVAMIPGMNQAEFCAAFGAMARSEQPAAMKAFRAAAAKRNIKLDEKRAAAGTITLGISSCQLYASWGTPESENRSVGSWGVHTQHVYGLRSYVYTRNGIVTSWQD